MSSSASPTAGQDAGQPSNPPGPGDGCSSPFLHRPDNLREETVLERQMVRITPPRYATNSTLLLESRKQNGVVESSQIKDTRLSSDRRDFFVRLRPLYVDKECQTDTLVASFNMDNSCDNASAYLHAETDGRGQTVESIPLSNTTHLLREEVDNSCKSNTGFVVADGDIESRDQELEDVNVIITESFAPKISSEIVKASDEPRLNGSVKNATNENKISSLKELPSEEKEDEDSCCVNCLYLTLNVCECVIL